MITLADRAKRFGQRLADGPALGLSGADLSDLGITAAQARQIEQWATGRYRLWSRSWMLGDAYLLAPKLREDPGFLGTLNGARITPSKHDS